RVEVQAGQLHCIWGSILKNPLIMHMLKKKLSPRHYMFRTTNLRVFLALQK
ncbi:MAG: hypothetical protein RL235_104, partial [Chlamydiota bacterium]